MKVGFVFFFFLKAVVRSQLSEIYKEQEQEMMNVFLNAVGSVLLCVSSPILLFP